MIKITSDVINEILKIKESYELPEKIMKILCDEKECTAVMEAFIKQNEDLDHDWFTEYFEEQHANKSKFAQDFTPKEVSALTSEIIGEAKIIADVCSGTGGLTIAAWNRNKDAEFICYELSGRAIPLLLLNLAIRNISAYVVQMDILTGEIFKKYRIEPGEKYGNVSEYKNDIPCMVDAVISNPPYSLKYKTQNDQRFLQFQKMLPSNFADYVFVAFALSIIKTGGKIVFIFPHGVLFRGNKEKEFRKYLIEKRLIRSVIGLPDKLFINTNIPTFIMEIDTSGKSDGVLFIDAKKSCRSDRAKNIIDEDSFEKILSTYRNRHSVNRFSEFVTYQRIKENDYNMNIPRYVDTYVPEPVPDLQETLCELAKLENDILKTKVEWLDMAKKLYGTTGEEDRKYRKAIAEYKKTVLGTREAFEQEVSTCDNQKM